MSKNNTIIVVTAHTPSLIWFRLDMMKKFISEGMEVIAIGNENSEKWADIFKKDDIKYIQLDVPRNGISPMKDFRYMLKLSSIFKEIKPQSLFLYQAKPVIYGSLGGRSANIKNINSLVAGLGSVYRGNGLKNNIIKNIMKFQYKVSLAKNKNVFFHNNDDRNIFLQDRIVTKDNSTVVNGSGVNMKIFKKTPLPEKISFLFVGRLIKDKGIQEFLDCARIVKKKYPEVIFNLVGPFDSNPSAIRTEDMDEYISEGSIVYHGESEDVYSHLRDNQVLILPSYHEGLPKTVVEAMAVGRAIITTNAPGCRETVQSGVNGFKVDPRSTEQLVEAVDTLIQNPILVSKFSEQSYSMCKEKFEIDIVNETIYSKIVRGENNEQGYE